MLIYIATHASLPYNQPNNLFTGIYDHNLGKYITRPPTMDVPSACTCTHAPDGTRTCIAATNQSGVGLHTTRHPHRKMLCIPTGVGQKVDLPNMRT